MEPVPDAADVLARAAARFADRDLGRRLKASYLQWWGDARQVVDLGCGDGDLLELLVARGIEAEGVDGDPGAVARCRARGLRVQHGDAIAWLREREAEGRALGGAAVVHVIEHLTPENAAHLLVALRRTLRPAARVVVVTPNPSSLIVLSETFWLDPTHVRPYPRPLLEALGAAAGFAVRASFDDPGSVPQRAGWKRLFASMRSAASGADRSAPMDSVVVLEQPPIRQGDSPIQPSVAPPIQHGAEQGS